MNRQPDILEQVKEVRRQLGLSQEELAHALGVSFASVNRWENGKARPSKLARNHSRRSATKGLAGAACHREG